MESKMKNGFTLWEGDSLIDGKPIVVIVTGVFNPSTNSKTGPMLQSYIIRQDINPSYAVYEKEDVSVCGNCPLRRTICYVNLKGVSQIWHAYKRGNYPRLSEQTLRYIIYFQKNLRIGAYGDPAAVPIEPWLALLKIVDGHTGYTHQWRNCDQRWKDIVRASTDTLEEMHEANAMGWKTFRVIKTDESPAKEEIICPNHVNCRIQCNQCLMCNGSGKNIADPVHGLGFKIKNFNQI
jgi:hypothetical protein